MTNILVICNYNRSVSKMAAAYLASKLDSKEYAVADAGMSVHKGDRIADGAVAALAERHLMTESTGCHAVSLKEIKQADLILCSSSEIVKKLMDSFHSARGKTLHIMTYAHVKRDVFEPRKNATSHTQCLNMMIPGLNAIAAKLNDMRD